MKKFVAVFLSAILALALLCFSVSAAYDAGNALDEKTSTLEGVATADLAGLGWKAFSSGSIEIATEEGNSYVHFTGPKNQYSAPSVNIFPAIQKIADGGDACVCIVLKLRFDSPDDSFEFSTAGMVVRSDVVSDFTPESNGVNYGRLNPVDAIEGDCGQWITVVVEYLEISSADLETEAVWQLTFDRLGPDGDEQAMQDGSYESKFTIDIDDVAVYDADYYDEHIAEAGNQGGETEEPEETEAPEQTETPAPTQAPTQAPTPTQTATATAAAPDDSESGNSNTGLIIGIVAAAVVVAAAIIAFVVIKKKKTEAGEQGSQEKE